MTTGFKNEVTNLHFTTVLRISPQFWTCDEHETTRELRRRGTEFAFHPSFGRPMSTKRREGCAAILKICISPQFWTSDEHEVTRGWSLDRPNPPCVKKEKTFKEVLTHSHSQQIFSVDLLSRSSAADLINHSQQIFQQIFSADLLSRFLQ